MKLKRNWKLWGSVFIVFVGVGVWRFTIVESHKAAPISISKEVKIAPKLKLPKMEERSNTEGKKSVYYDTKGKQPAYEKKQLPGEKKEIPTVPPPPAPALPPVTVPKEPVDLWGWVIKIGGVLSGLKTLLDIIDKLKSKSQKSITVPIDDVPKGSKVTITIVIEKLVDFMLSPIRLFKR